MDFKVNTKKHVTKILAAQNRTSLYRDLGERTAISAKRDSMSFSVASRSYLNCVNSSRTNVQVSGEKSSGLPKSFSKLYLRKNGASQISVPSQEFLHKKIETLTSELQNDPTFANKSNREFINHPLAKELASTIILADRELQDQIAQKLWNDTASANNAISNNPSLLGPARPIPPDWQDYDIPAMLMSADKDTVNQVLFAFDGVMVRRARTDGLNDTERFLSKRYERIEFTSHATFQDKMESIAASIEKKFRENGLTLDSETSFTFSLDSESFTFSVSGGSDAENRLMEEIVNTTNIFGHSYDEDNVGQIIRSILFHRREDGSYNSWVTGISSMDPALLREEMKKNGIANVPSEYSEKIKQLPAAYDRYRLDQRLKKEYGFGINDLKLQNGKIIGKTNEVTAAIQEKGHDFMKEVGYAYLSIIKEYRGTPSFSSPLFTFTGGNFQVMYQT